MPAIASLEDLRAAQKEGLSIYTMLYAVGIGIRSNRMSFNWVDNSALRTPNSAFGIWHAPEKLKGEWK